MTDGKTLIVYGYINFSKDSNSDFLYYSNIIAPELKSYCSVLQRPITNRISDYSWRSPSQESYLCFLYRGIIHQEMVHILDINLDLRRYSMISVTYLTTAAAASTVRRKWRSLGHSTIPICYPFYILFISNFIQSLISNTQVAQMNTRYCQVWDLKIGVVSHETRKPMLQSTSSSTSSSSIVLLSSSLPSSHSSYLYQQSIIFGKTQRWVATSSGFGYRFEFTFLLMYCADMCSNLVCQDDMLEV